MRKYALLAVLAFVVLSACSTVSSMVPGVSLPSSLPGASSPLAGMVEFREGEVLCAAGSDAYRENFLVARVVTAPSAATKNQAEVIYVTNGQKEWVNFVIPSRKAEKTDFVVGKVLFVPDWNKVDNAVTSDEYRKTPWGLARVTSTSELFKDIVEVGGDRYYWKNVRVPIQEP